MKKIELLGLDQDIYYEELSSGLKVVLLPFLNKKNYYAVYSTKYGSLNINFNNKTSNLGIAHFLEHKLFETEDGIDPFEFFSKSGTECNASTSYKKTMYYILGINNFEENLNYLINCINSPYFTDSNVEKEKGIIIQEIKMYDDKPEWILCEEMAKSTFHNHPIKYDIAGYPETVNKITKEELYDCYNTFYQPSNMFLLVSGNIDVDDTIKIIKNNKKLNKKVNNNKIKLDIVDEPYLIKEKYKKIEMDSVITPKLGLSIKLKNEKDNYKYYIYINCILSILIGSSSDFIDRMYKKELATTIEYDTLIVDDYMLIEIFAESKNPDLLYKKILKQLKKKISKEEFERQIKVYIAREVMLTDNIESTVNSILSDYITWGRLIDNKIEILKSLSYEELLNIQNNMDINNSSIVIINPSKK